jgi:hypothetical protein
MNPVIYGVGVALMVVKHSAIAMLRKLTQNPVPVIDKRTMWASFQASKIAPLHFPACNPRSERRLSSATYRNQASGSAYPTRLASIRLFAALRAYSAGAILVN